MSSDYEELESEYHDSFCNVTAERLAKAKREARSELKTPAAWKINSYCTRSLLWSKCPAEDGIARIHADDVSVEEFRERFERPNLPCAIEGCADNWLGSKTWTPQQLATRFKDCLLKCGEDDEGYKVKLKLKYFLAYQKYQKDDSPLYIFDGNYGDKKPTDSLLDEYDVPKYFTEDLFRLVGETRRPPYRWFLLGPARSGTNLHIDPLATSAWNTLISGVKRWVLYPPSATKPPIFQIKGEDKESVTYFIKVLERARNNPEEKERPIEFVQRPGDTVFIPGGWWHAVLNVTDTVAVTQNFVSSVNFEKVWMKTRKGRPKMSLRWLDQLDIHYPELAAIAHRHEKEDGWEAKTARLREKKKQLREAKRQKKLRKQQRRLQKQQEAQEAARAKQASPMTSGQTVERVNSINIAESATSAAPSQHPPSPPSDGSKPATIEGDRMETDPPMRTESAKADKKRALAEAKADRKREKREQRREKRRRKQAEFREVEYDTMVSRALSTR